MKINNFYNEISPGYEELYKDEQLKKLRIILDNLEIKKRDFLLDVGCGTAFYFDFINCKKIGVDPSSELLKLSKHKNKIIKAEAENLPFKDKTFDVVISITAIHNFKNIEKALREIKRVGKDRFAFSILKRSKKFNKIIKLIKKNFKIKKSIDEEKDLIIIED